MNIAQEIFSAAQSRGLTTRPALLCEDRTLTYGELEQAANRFGNALMAEGVARGERVLFLLDDSPELVAAYLGTLKIGAVAVALNLRMAPVDLLFILRESECHCLVVHQEFLPLYQGIADQLNNPPRVIVVEGRVDGCTSLDDFLGSCSDILAAAPTSADDMAYWVYSSGTTGKPKATVHLHRDITVASLHVRQNLGVKPGDRVFTTSKLFFAFALGHSLLGGLAVGATVILYRGWPEAHALARVIARLEPDVLFSVPVMYRSFLREGLAGGEGFKRIRHFVSAGEKLPAPIFEAWQAQTGQPIIEGIGSSETIFLFIANTPKVFRAGSSGKPLPWAEVRIVDEFDRTITSADTPGTLWVRMVSVCAGYWQRPELNERTFRDGWYATGDTFSFDAEGWWYHQGRSDDMLKVSGQWVSPAEIESCALAVPGIADAAVVGVPNDDGLVRLALFLVAKPDSDPDVLGAMVQAHLRATLAIYKCPRNIHFLQDLPRTATGKTQKFRLREMLQADAMHPEF